MGELRDNFKISIGSSLKLKSCEEAHDTNELIPKNREFAREYFIKCLMSCVRYTFHDFFQTWEIVKE